jgi:hypothetical protein
LPLARDSETSTTYAPTKNTSQISRSPHQQDESGQELLDEEILLKMLKCYDLPLVTFLGYHVRG